MVGCDPMIAAFFFFCAFAALVIYPLFALFSRSFGDPAFLEHLLAPETLAIVVFTLKQAALSLGVALTFGIPLGFYFSRYWSSRVRANLLTLYSMPTLMTAMAVVLLLRGTEFRFGLPAVVIAHAILNVPWIALVVGEGLYQFPERLREAARVSGARTRDVFWHHEWPYLLTRLIPASLQVFSLCVMSFALVLLLGGGPPVQTLETEIYARVRMGDPDFSRASVFAVWQFIAAAVPGVLAWVFTRRFASGFSRATLEAREVPRRARGAWGILAELASLALFYPYLLILFGNPEVLKLESWRTFFADAEIYSSVRTSLALALGVGGTTSVLSVLAVSAAPRARITAMLGTWPAGISALVLSLGFWFAYASFVDPFEGSLLAMILIQSTLLLPFGVRLLLPLVRERNVRAYEAARLLGAGPARAWFDVEFPRAKGPLLSVFGIASACSLGEVAAVSLFASEKVTPLPLLLSRLMSQYRFDEAALLSVFLFALSFVLVRVQVRA